MMKRFLKIKNSEVVDGNDQPVIFKGVNLGGWLMMEGYILYSLNVAEQVFKKKFEKELGDAALYAFEKSFRDNFIQERDIQQIAQLGFNCIRLPFNCRLIEKQPFQYDPQGLVYLDRVIAWGKKYKVWIILDLHAAIGAQNHDWHSDSLGKAELWTEKSYQERTFALWEFIADRYKEEEGIAGYDLLNESVLEDTKILNSFYKKLIKRIRRIDGNHILFIEGNTWATDLNCLELFEDDNLALSIHFYVPLEFTANLVPHLSYPFKSAKGHFTKENMKKIFVGYKKLAQKQARPIYVGEFGVNYRQGFYGEDQWLKDVLGCFKEFGFHWTYWTYKAVKNSIFPDGIFSYFPNPPWVNRQGPRLGWDNYIHTWPQYKKEMIHSWRTDSFTENTPIVQSLKNACR